MAFNRFDRMVAIPEEEYSQLRNVRLANDPLQAQFQTLNNEFRKRDNITDPYVRVQRQGEVLDEMIKIKDLLRQRLIESTPKPYQSRAETLFNFMKDKIHVNDKGELSDASGQSIPGSNIIDLVHHAVRDRRRKIMPSGWSNFVSYLRELNAPKMVMNYDTVDELRAPSVAMYKDLSEAKAKSKIPVPVEIKTRARKTPKRLNLKDVPKLSFSFDSTSTPKKVSSKKYLRKLSRKRREPDYFHHSMRHMY